MTEIKELTKKKITELVELAKELGIDSSGKKDELIQKIIDFHAGNNKINDSKSKSDSKIDFMLIKHRSKKRSKK